MPKAIIFDFDGVLADTYDLHFELSKTFDTDLSEQDFKDHHNGNVFETPKIRFKEGDMPIFFEKQKEQFTKTHLFPLKSMLTDLQKKYQLFIVSSGSDENIHHFLRLDGYEALFEAILGATTHSSKVEKFKMIFERYSLQPEECLFVTDTTGDIIESRKVGMKTVAVLWGYHGKEILEKENPFAIVRDENELRKVIESFSTMEGV
jgi:HAD superfamily hydrolase (TIGR01549 family)